jgi:hypothetical protein
MFLKLPVFFLFSQPVYEICSAHTSIEFRGLKPTSFVKLKTIFLSFKRLGCKPEDHIVIVYVFVNSLKSNLK